MTFSKFDRYVERHARSFTERLQNLCRMPSVAARATGMRAIAETVEQSMQRVGMGTRSFRMGSGYPIIYGECGGGRAAAAERQRRYGNEDDSDYEDDADCFAHPCLVCMLGAAKGKKTRGDRMFRHGEERAMLSQGSYGASIKSAFKR